MLNMHRWRLSPSTKLHHKALLDVNKVYNLKGKTNKISECLWESIKLCLFFTHRQRPSKVISIEKNDFVFAQTFDYFFLFRSRRINNNNILGFLSVHYVIGLWVV